MSSLRHRQTRQGAFFEIKDGEITMILPVARQFKTLRQRISVLGEPSKDWLVHFLGLHMLLVVIGSCFEHHATTYISSASLFRSLIGLSGGRWVVLPGCIVDIDSGCTLYGCTEDVGLDDWIWVGS